METPTDPLITSDKPCSSTEKEFHLISQANEEFSSTNYDKCLEALEQLEQSTGINAKLKHNRAVVQFYKSRCKNYDSLLKVLNELNADAENQKNSQFNSTHKTIARYNTAVIYFHRHMYMTAIETLTPLVDKFDTLEEGTAILVGILMLKLLLATNQLKKAEAFLEQLQVHVGLRTDQLSSDEPSSTSETFKCLDDTRRTGLLLVMLTHVLNRNIVVVPEDESAEFAALKAHQYYIMKDFQMAAKQLKKISSENSTIIGTNSDELNTCIANNMGVIHLRVRHYAIAAKFFQNAITFDKNVATNLREASLHEMGSARSCEILYNLGISMLYLQRPKEAFQCFLVPLKVYHSNPRLWFRMAEACIMDYEMKKLDEEKKAIVNMNSNRKYAFKSPRVLYSPSNQSSAVPEPTLEFAALSLRNALTLTTYYKSHFHAQSTDESEKIPVRNWKQAKDNNFCNPSQPISQDSLNNMLSAIYAAYSYVSLRLGDYIQALEMAREMLKAEKLSDAYKMLAHMYAGEALIMMDKIDEARPYLEPTFVSSLNTFDFETNDWQVKSLDAAQNIVRYNLAVAMTLQGDFELARSLLSTCTHAIVTSKVMSLQIYLNMRAAGKSTNTAMKN